MAQAPGNTSTQNSLLLNLTSAKQAGTLIHIQNSNDNDILTFSPTKSFQSIAFSSVNLVKGNSYDVYLGGNSTGTPTDGLYDSDTYSGGTKYTAFTVNNVLSKIGNTPGPFGN